MGHSLMISNVQPVLKTLLWILLKRSVEPTAYLNGIYGTPTMDYVNCVRTAPILTKMLANVFKVASLSSSMIIISSYASLAQMDAVTVTLILIREMFNVNNV
jgi:hypothetical protein